MFTANDFRDDDPFNGGEIFLDVALVPGGAQLFEKLLSHLDKGSLGCQAPDACRFLAWGILPKTPERRLIVRCGIPRNQQSLGAIRGCVPIAQISATKRELVATIVLKKKMEKAALMGLRDAELEFVSSRPRPIEDLAGALGGVLRSPPLEMRVVTRRREQSMVMEAISDGRRSSLLPGGWREKATVRVSVDLYGTAAGTGASGELFTSADIDLATTLYISKTNTLEAADWRLPEDAQGRLYADRVVDALSDGLRALCPKENNGAQSGSRRIRCSYEAKTRCPCETCIRIQARLSQRRPG